MSKLFTRILTTTAIISTTGASAFAGSPMLEKIDTNKDGLIQKAEFTSFADQKFSATDVDGNGLVTKEERKAQRARMGEARAKAKFSKLDRDSNGSISEAEFMAARDARKARVMKRRDVNGDGQVDQQDKMARKEMHKKMKEKMKGKKTKHKAAHEGSKHAGMRPKIDTNGDGAVDLAEHQVATLARFAHMDKNSDNVLSADEQRPPKRMRGKRKKHHGQKHHGQKQDGQEQDGMRQ
jgi:Ca2+-binding EF-hand superfamily protein